MKIVNVAKFTDANKSLWRGVSDNTILTMKIKLVSLVSNAGNGMRSAFPSFFDTISIFHCYRRSKSSIKCSNIFFYYFFNLEVQKFVDEFYVKCYHGMYWQVFFRIWIDKCIYIFRCWYSAVAVTHLQISSIKQVIASSTQ